MPAVAFYVDVLGLAQRQDRPADLGVDGVWLDAGGQQVHLIHAPPPTARGNTSHCSSTISTPPSTSCATET